MLTRNHEDSLPSWVPLDENTVTDLSKRTPWTTRPENRPSSWFTFMCRGLRSPDTAANVSTSRAENLLVSSAASPTRSTSPQSLRVFNVQSPGHETFIRRKTIIINKQHLSQWAAWRPNTPSRPSCPNWYTPRWLWSVRTFLRFYLTVCMWKLWLPDSSNPKFGWATECFSFYKSSFSLQTGWEIWPSFFSSSSSSTNAMATPHP